MLVTGHLLPIVQVLLAIVTLLWISLANLSKTRKLQQFTSSGVRLALYRRAILTTMLFAIAAIVVAWPKNLFVIAIAKEEAPWLLVSGARRAIAIAVLLAFYVMYAGQILYFSRNAPGRRMAMKYMRSMKYMLPVSASERRWFALVSINAGISEEIFFRGFLLQFLCGKLALDTGISLTGALTISSVAFGLGHLYQGVGGIAKTAFVASIFGITTILTGGLLWPIILHALIDLAGLLLYRPQLDSPEEAARLILGCDPNLPLERPALDENNPLTGS